MARPTNFIVPFSGEMVVVADTAQEADDLAKDFRLALVNVDHKAVVIRLFKLPDPDLFIKV